LENTDSRRLAGKISGIMGLALTVGLPTNWLPQRKQVVCFQLFAAPKTAEIPDEFCAPQEPRDGMGRNGRGIGGTKAGWPEKRESLHLWKKGTTPGR
jgi:hypothetical protein